VGVSPAGTLGAGDPVADTPVEAGTETEGVPEGAGCWLDAWLGHTVTVSLMVTVGTGVAVALGGGVKVLLVGLHGTTVVRVSVMVGTGLTEDAGVVVGKAVCVAGQTVTVD
jgi:hypothetical protein